MIKMCSYWSVLNDLDGLLLVPVTEMGSFWSERLRLIDMGFYWSEQLKWALIGLDLLDGLLLG